MNEAVKYHNRELNDFYDKVKNVRIQVNVNPNDEDKIRSVQRGSESVTVSSEIVSRSLIHSKGDIYQLGNAEKVFNLPMNHWIHHAGVEMDRRSLDEWKQFTDVESINATWLLEGESIPEDDIGYFGARTLLVGTVAAGTGITRVAEKATPFNLAEMAVVNTTREFTMQIQSKLLTGLPGLGEMSGAINAPDVDTQDATGGSKAAIEAGIQSIHDSRGNPNMIIVNPATKTALMDTSWGTGYAWLYDGNSPTGQSCYGLPAAIDTDLDDGVAVVGDFAQGAFLLVDDEMMLRVLTGRKANGAKEIYAFLDVAAIMRGKLFSVISNIS